MSKPKVYIESTVVSYLTAEPSRDLLAAAHQQITREWWQRVLPLCEPYVSPVVLEEIVKGDREQARRRLDAVSGMSSLTMNQDIHRLANLYFTKIDLPERAMADAFHLALATWHQMDYLVTWNCSHIASGRVRAILERLNAKAKLHKTVMCTPEELMEV